MKKEMRQARIMGVSFWALLLILIFSSSEACAQWWDSDWTHRVEITADADSSVTDAGFLYMVPLSDMPAGFWTNTQTDGDDIRVISDAGKEVPFYVEQFDDSGEKGTLYFLAGSSSTIDSVFSIYYGNSGASGHAVGDTYGQYNTFANYDYYYPMTGAEGTGESVKNLVTDDSHLDPQGTKTGDAVTGQMDHDAYDMDGKMYWVDPTGAGADDWARGVNDAAHFGQGMAFPVTISVWFNLRVLHLNLYNHASFTFGGTAYPVGQYYSSSNRRVWHMSFDGRNDGDMSALPVKLGFTKYSESAVSSGISFAVPNDTLALDEWQLFTVSISADGTDADIFLNGKSIGGGTLTDNSLETNTSSTHYPGTALARSTKNPDGVMFGSIQDLSFADSKMTADHIGATYSMQNTPDTFWAVGAEEANAVARRRIMIGAISPFILFLCGFYLYKNHINYV